MATAGTGTPSTNGPEGEQAGAGVTGGSGLPTEGQDLEATASTGGAARAEGAQVARGRTNQEGGKTQRAALLEQAEKAAAKLKELMAKLKGTWVSPLADTELRVVALAVRLVPAAECLETVRESLVSHAGQPDSAREQMHTWVSHSCTWQRRKDSKRPQRRRGRPQRHPQYPQERCW
jgi:hypothetical protein